MLQEKILAGVAFSQGYRVNYGIRAINTDVPNLVFIGFYARCVRILQNFTRIAREKSQKILRRKMERFQFSSRLGGRGEAGAAKSTHLYSNAFQGPSRSLAIKL